MKTILALAATLLLAACAPTTTPVANDAGAVATAHPSATPPGTAGAARGATFDAALAAAHLTRVEVKLQREMEHDLSAASVKVEGNKVVLMVSAGWSGESLEFARDPSGRLVRLIRQPEVTTKEVVITGCQETAFAGGRAWFERVEIELAAGTTWGGNQVVIYPEVREVVRYTGKTADGKDCPPPRMMLD